MRESVIEAYLVKVVRSKGGRAYKFNSVCNRGVADRLCLLPNGKLFFVELKSLTGKQTELQKFFEKEVVSLGQRYIVLNSKEAIDRFITEEMK